MIHFSGVYMFTSLWQKLTCFMVPSNWLGGSSFEIMRHRLSYVNIKLSRIDEGYDCQINVHISSGY